MEKSGKKKNTRWILVMCVGLLILLAVVLIILFLLQGEATYTTGSGDVEIVQSVSCESDQYIYPFLPNSNDDGRKIKITIVLNKDKLESAYLTYEQFFKSKERAESISEINSVAIAKSFAENNIDYDALDKKISTLSGATQLSLYAKRTELSSSTSKYFLLDSLVGSYSVNSITKLYNEKGLDCVISK